MHLRIQHERLWVFSIMHVSSSQKTVNITFFCRVCWLSDYWIAVQSEHHRKVVRRASPLRCAAGHKDTFHRGTMPNNADEAFATFTSFSSIITLWLTRHNPCFTRLPLNLVSLLTYLTFLPSQWCTVSVSPSASSQYTWACSETRPQSITILCIDQLTFLFFC